MNTNPSQSQAILQFLTARAGEWVAMPALASHSGAYAVHSRVSELRKRGHDIQCRVVQREGAKHSFYRLVFQPEPGRCDPCLG